MNTPDEEKDELSVSHIPAEAPLMIFSNTGLTSTPQAGAIENDGASLFYTDHLKVRQAIISGNIHGSVPVSVAPSEWLTVVVKGKQYLMPLYSVENEK